MLDFNQIGDKGIAVLFLLTNAVLKRNQTVRDMFKEFIYTQTVKTKTKQSNVEILPAQDLFKTMVSKWIVP